MLKRKVKNSFEENQDFYAVVGIGALVITGVVIGMRLQRKIDVRLVAKNLSNVAIFKKEVNPMFPDTMPIADIKEALLKIEGATFFDALVTNVNGVQSIIVR
jgi:hypothetical protein